jgi:tripartite-type tricarboxylate transporter receptor subunit TctC
MSKETISRINTAIVAALQSPSLEDKYAKLFAQPVPTTPSDFDAFMKSERVKYKDIVKLSGAHID